MNAYELAEYLDKQYVHSQGVADAVSMLRQQADRIGVLEANHKIQVNINEKALQYIAELEKDLHMTERHYERLHTQTKPLSDEEIPYLHILQNAHTVPLGSEIWKTDEELQKYKKIIVATVRAIEERHGIK